MKIVAIRFVASFSLISALLAAQHPAFTAPAGFVPAGEKDGVRSSVQKLSNGDVLRLGVLLVPGATDLDATAKGPALGENDKVREDTRQDIAVGGLSGVAYSCLGATESLGGVPFTRYRRVMAFKLAGGAEPFAVRADVLAKEPRPATSTLETMAKALGEWHARLGGATEPPADPEAKDPASRPVLGGEEVVTLSGGGDLELRVPRSWGRTDLKQGVDGLEILLGPARDVVSAATAESLSKDKDRIGPYISIARIRRDAFKDLVDSQLPDIADSLIADYVAKQSDAGVALTTGVREDGTLGTRVVSSAPFEEKRSSGTTHKGRALFMMHRGFLVVVVASHPTEMFDEGWPDIAKAFDTLRFTGAPEAADPQPVETASSQPAPGTGTGPATDASKSATDEPPKTATPSQPEPQPQPAAAGPRAPGPLRLPPAPAAWLGEPRGAMRQASLPLPNPVVLSIPATWTLVGDASPQRAVRTFVATPAPDRASDPLRSAVRVEYHAFLEELTTGDALSRLSALLDLRVTRDAREAGGVAVQSRRVVGGGGLGGLPAATVQYGLAGASGETSGTMAAVVFDGTVIMVDVRTGPAERAAFPNLAVDVLNSARIDSTLNVARRAFPPFSVEIPADWTVNDAENAARGRDVFLRSPAGVDVRFQTALQSHPEVFNPDVLRKITNGFAVEGLRVLTATDLARGTRHLQPTARVGMRFQSTGADRDVLALAMLEQDQLVFALRAAPPDYHGRDLAVAWRVMRSFRYEGAPDVPPQRFATRGGAVAERTVFAREELDGAGPDGAPRPRSGILVALLPNGAAGVVVSENGSERQPTATYRISGNDLLLDIQGVGPRTYRITEDGETLSGEDGRVLFRTRAEETP